MHLLEFRRSQEHFPLCNTFLSSLFKAKVLLKNVNQNTNIRKHKPNAEKHFCTKISIFKHFFSYPFVHQTKKVHQNTSFSQCYSISAFLGPQNPQVILNGVLAPISRQFFIIWVVPQFLAHSSSFTVALGSYRSPEYCLWKWKYRS